MVRVRLFIPEGSAPRLCAFSEHSGSFPRLATRGPPPHGPLVGKSECQLSGGAPLLVELDDPEVVLVDLVGELRQVIRTREPDLSRAPGEHACRAVDAVVGRAVP